MNLAGILGQIPQGAQDPYAQMNPEGMPPQGMPMQEMPPQLAPQQMPQPSVGPLMEPPFDRLHQAYMGGADFGSGENWADDLSVTAEDIERYLMMFQQWVPPQDAAKTNEVTIKVRKSR
jgi:hypothetical protein